MKVNEECDKISTNKKKRETNSKEVPHLTFYLVSHADLQPVTLLPSASHSSALSSPLALLPSAGRSFALG